MNKEIPVGLRGWAVAFALSAVSHVWSLEVFGGFALWVTYLVGKAAGRREEIKGRAEQDRQDAALKEEIQQKEGF